MLLFGTLYFASILHKEVKITWICGPVLQKCSQEQDLSRRTWSRVKTSVVGDEPTNSTLLNSCTPQDFEGCWMWFYDVPMGLLHLAHANIPFIHERLWEYSIRYLRNRHDIQVQRQTKQVWMPWMKLLQNITHTCTLSMTSTSTKSSFRAAVSATFSKVRRINWQSLSNAEQRRIVCTIIAHSHRIKSSSPSSPSSPSCHEGLPHHATSPYGNCCLMDWK